MDDLLNSKQLAQKIGVRPSTIYSWVSRGVDIPCIRIQGTLRFRESSVEAWLIEKESRKKRQNFED